MGKIIAFKAGDALHEGLKEYCRRYKVSKSEAMRRALRDLLQKTVWNPNLKEEEGS